MARYICKCGRVVNKSTNADNTGNRNTDGCEGCPYLLPWGPTQWDSTRHAMVTEVKGYECRMSPSISYASTYYGSANDKCTLRIISLDLDFLEEIQAWMERYTEGQLYGGFSRNTIRSTDYSNEGRYSWSISCAQNKQGMAAKAELIQRFFRPDKSRRDKTPEEEKAHILAAIEAGKAAYRKKENMEYIISENLENDCVYAYAAKEFWVYDKQACRWYTSGFCRDQYEQAKLQCPSLTPEDFLEEGTDYNLLGDYELPRAALDALLEAVKGGKREAAPFEDTNPTDADADASPCAPGASDALSLPSQSADADAQKDANDDLPEVCRSCQCTTCANEDCVTPCWLNDREVRDCERLGPGGDDCKDYQPKEDAQCLKKPVPNGDAALNGDAAASMVENAAQEPQMEETPTALKSATDSPAPASPAGAGAATQSLSAAAPASLAADPAPAFDYSGMDIATVDTLHWAEREIGEARRDYVARLAQAVYIVHDELVQNLHKQNNQHGECTFISWCASVGLSRRTAYNLLQVNALLSGATPEEQATLEAASPSLLYAAAKPSAPAELVQAVKDGDITTHKQFKELEAQLKAERQAREKAEHDAQRYREDSEKAREAAHTYHCQYEQANQQRNALLDQQTEYISRIEAARQQAKDAQARGKQDAALVEKLQDILLQRDNKLAEQEAQLGRINFSLEDAGRRIQEQADTIQELEAELDQKDEVIRQQGRQPLEAVAVVDQDEVQRQARLLAEQSLPPVCNLLTLLQSSIQQAWDLSGLAGRHAADEEDESACVLLRQYLLSLLSEISDIAGWEEKA